MSQVDDGQAASITGGKADAAAVGAGGTTAPGAHKATVETFVSGTARQIAATDAEVYIAVTTSAALKVEIGPTSGVATTIMPSQSAALGVITVQVPGGWYMKLTGTVADFTVTSVLK